LAERCLQEPSARGVPKYFFDPVCQFEKPLRVTQSDIGEGKVDSIVKFAIWRQSSRKVHVSGVSKRRTDITTASRSSKCTTRVLSRLRKSN
jgi:hypothetical protein